jgi:hypothetical protein
VPLSLAACLGLVALAGCGEGEGVADDAVVSVYVAAPLCSDAQGGRAGGVRVRVACLDPVERGGRLDLAQVGANARRATEDSSSVAYLEQAGPAGRFSRPIVDSAGIAYLSARTGEAAMARVLDAVEASGGERAAVADALAGR